MLQAGTFRLERSRRGRRATAAGRAWEISLLLILILVFQVRGAAAQIFERVTTGPTVATGGNSWGTSWIDYDMDGYLDLFVVANNSTSISRHCLFRNNGDGTFSEITSGPLGTDPYLTGGGCSWGDYDGDGDPDLVVVNWEEQDNLLYRNDGGGVFTKQTEHVVASDPGWSIGPSWIDYDLDGRLDLFIANHGSGIGTGDGQNWLYRNTGSGFVKMTGSVVSLESAASNCGVWGDMDADGDPDLFVANFFDNPGGRLYRNDGDGTFTLLEDSPVTLDTSNSIGGSWGDYDNDGALDLFVTASPVNRLYHNDGAGGMTLVTGQRIATDASYSSGSAWGDIDNDGDLDLFVCNGSYNQRVFNYIYINDGAGVFTRLTGEPVATDQASSSGVSFGDYDGDGALDIYVSNVYQMNENNFLYRNLGGPNHWLIVRCRGVDSNRMAIGARIKVKATIQGQEVWQTREIASQTGYNGQNAPEAHFGLGDAATADSVTIAWPGGSSAVLTGVASDAIIEVEEDTSTVATFLQDFIIESVEGSVLLRWSVSEESGPEDFLLTAARSGGSSSAGSSASVSGPASPQNEYEWVLDVEMTGATTFTAKDSPGERAVEGEIRYSLFHRDETGEWKLMYAEDYEYLPSFSPLAITGIVPNPFNPSTSIRFSTGERTVVTISIFDCTGRLVRELGNSVFSPGSHSVFWNGRDRRDRVAASGVYYARLRSGKNTDCRKLVLLR